MKENIIISKTLEFSLKIIEFVEVLEKHKKYVISKQLLRSSTSIGANVREAQKSESRADFIHKIKIAEKEAEETEYWLLLCKKSPNYPSPNDLFDILKEIQNIIAKIIITSKLKYSKK